MTILSQEAIDSALAGLPGWRVTDGELRKTFNTGDFAGALKLVNQAGALAEAAGHHPDITIKYNRVTFALVTHDQGGITEKDIALAAQIETI